jgi:hypothetical protein
MLRLKSKHWSLYVSAVKGSDIVFTDRYSALGMSSPDPGTMCHGQCEGTGVVPIGAGESDPVFLKLWQEAEAREHADDGYHFVTCPECHGSGLAEQGEALAASSFKAMDTQTLKEKIKKHLNQKLGIKPETFESTHVKSSWVRGAVDKVTFAKKLEVGDRANWNTIGGQSYRGTVTELDDDVAFVQLDDGRRRTMTMTREEMGFDAAKKTMVWDFDGTLAEEAPFPEIGAPIEENIELLRKAKDAGIEVVIQSCRWSEHELSDAETAAKHMVDAIAWLEEHNVPYDRLEAGKPLAEHYIDDRSIPANDHQWINRAIEEMASEYPVDGTLAIIAAQFDYAWVAPDGVYAVNGYHGDWVRDNADWLAKKYHLDPKQLAGDRGDFLRNKFLELNADHPWVAMFSPNMGYVWKWNEQTAACLIQYCSANKNAYLDEDCDVIEFEEISTGKRLDVSPLEEVLGLEAGVRAGLGPIAEYLDMLRRMEGRQLTPQVFEAKAKELAAGKTDEISEMINKEYDHKKIVRALQAIRDSGKGVRVDFIASASIPVQSWLYLRAAEDCPFCGEPLFDGSSCGCPGQKANALKLEELMKKIVDRGPFGDLLKKFPMAGRPKCHIDPLDPYLAVPMLWIEADPEGQGLGTEVLNTFKAMAKKAGVDLVLEVSTDWFTGGPDEDLKRWYHRHGFRKLPKKDSPGENYWMRKTAAAELDPLKPKPTLVRYEWLSYLDPATDRPKSDWDRAKTCDHCGRPIVHLCYFSDGHLYGQDCAIKKLGLTTERKIQEVINTQSADERNLELNTQECTKNALTTQREAANQCRHRNKNAAKDGPYDGPLVVGTFKTGYYAIPVSNLATPLNKSKIGGAAEFFRQEKPGGEFLQINDVFASASIPRFWIEPSGKVHELKGEQLHEDWLAKNKLGKSAPAKVAEGWVRVVCNLDDSVLYVTANTEDQILPAIQKIAAKAPQCALVKQVIGTWAGEQDARHRVAASKDGSSNFKDRIKRGWVMGSPKYASSEPHHQRSESGAWTYEEMYDESRDAALISAIDGSGPEVSGVYLRWEGLDGESGKYYLVRTLNGIVDEIEIPEDRVLEFQSDNSENRNDIIVEESFDSTVGPGGTISPTSKSGATEVKGALKIAAAGEAHTYGCLMVDFPEDLAKKVMAWTKENVPDEAVYDNEAHDYGRENHIHTTVCYGVDPATDPGAIQSLVYQENKPIEVTLGPISKFAADPSKEKGGEKKLYDVLKVEVFSPDLHRLHEKAETELGLPGNTFPDYVPHLTLAYVHPDSCDHLLGADPFEGQKFKLTRFEYSYPPEPGAKDEKVHYDISQKGDFEASLVPRGMAWKANKFTDLQKKALDIIESDPKWKEALSNPETAQAYGQLQQSVRDSRNEGELQQAWTESTDLPWSVVEGIREEGSGERGETD